MEIIEGLIDINMFPIWENLPPSDGIAWVQLGEMALDPNMDTAQGQTGPDIGQGDSGILPGNDYTRLRSE